MIALRYQRGLNEPSPQDPPSTKRAEGFRPALFVVGSSTFEGGEMEMQIVAPDASSASALAERLASAFGSDRISLGGGLREVDVHIDPEPEPALARVLDAVEQWFEQARVGSIEIRFGERSYKLAQWVRVDT